MVVEEESMVVTPAYIPNIMFSLTAAQGLSRVSCRAKNDCEFAVEEYTFWGVM